MKKRIKRFALVAAILLITSCFTEEDYDKINPRDLLTFNDHVQTAKADGSDAVTVSVSLNSKIPKEKRIVTIKTTLGNFALGKGDSIVLKGDEDGDFSTRLVSSKVGVANISAKIDDYMVIDSQTISFSRVYPVQITARVDSFAIRNTFKSEILITASMKSDNGIPSQGHAVTFNSYSSSGIPIGQFLNGINYSTSDENGKVQIRYSAGSTPYRGKITLVAETIKEDGSPIQGGTVIDLID